MSKLLINDISFDEINELSKYDQKMTMGGCHEPPDIIIIQPPILPPPPTYPPTQTPIRPQDIEFLC